MNTLENVRKAPASKTMGIEIEMCVQYSHMEDSSYFGFFYRGYDGSIRRNHGTSGVEWVSQPLTFNWMKKEIGKLYKKLDGKFSVNGSCGIHVHVSRKWCSEKKAEAIYETLKELSGDDLYHIFGRSSTQWTDEPFGNRYCLVNNNPEKTIEFRMFKSGDEKWAQYCVDCVKYMVENAFHFTADGLRAFRDMYKFD